MTYGLVPVRAPGIRDPFFHRKDTGSAAASVSEFKCYILFIKSFFVITMETLAYKN